MFESAYIDDGERYKGFAMSPTHYSVYALCASVLVYKLVPLRRYLLIYLLSLLGLVFLSETRLSLLVFMLITSIFIFSEHVKKYLKLYFVMMFLFFSLSYPIYGVIYQYTKVVSLRYEGDADKSFDSRLLIQQVIFNEFSHSEEKDLLLGHGAEAARDKLIQSYGEDVMPHNDFIRIIYDYGILGFSFFVILLYLLSTKNIYTLSFSAIYLSSFYHNMAFSLYVIAMIIISGKLFGLENEGDV
jgi:O-antigen ligase